jgi:hypothetical protein
MKQLNNSQLLCSKNKPAPTSQPAILVFEQINTNHHPNGEFGILHPSCVSVRCPANAGAELDGRVNMALGR